MRNDYLFLRRSSSIVTYVVNGSASFLSVLPESQSLGKSDRNSLGTPTTVSIKAKQTKQQDVELVHQLQRPSDYNDIPPQLLRQYSAAVYQKLNQQFVQLAKFSCRLVSRVQHPQIVSCMAQSVEAGSGGHGAAGDHPKLILVTGAGGAVGSVGSKLVAMLTARGFPVRAQVRRLDERSEALTKMGAELVVADFTHLDDTMRAVQGCDRVFFCLSVSDEYLEAALNMAAAAKHHGVEVFVNLSQMTVSQMSITNITNATTSKQQRYHWLVEQALAWSGLPVVEVRGTLFLEHPFFYTMAAKTIRKSGELRLPFRTAKISPTAAMDVTRVAFEVITNPRGHLGKVYEVVGPESLDGDAMAAQYSKALGRDVKYVDVPMEEWVQTDLAEQHFSEHLRNHFMTLAAKTVKGENDRYSDDVELVTGVKALTIEEWVRQNIHAFTDQ